MWKALPSWGWATRPVWWGCSGPPAGLLSCTRGWLCKMHFQTLWSSLLRHFYRFSWIFSRLHKSNYTSQTTKSEKAKLEANSDLFFSPKGTADWKTMTQMVLLYKILIKYLLETYSTKWFKTQWNQPNSGVSWIWIQTSEGTSIHLPLLSLKTVEGKWLRKMIT